MTIQSKVFEFVKARGYFGNELTQEQHTARQVAKLLEELSEACVNAMLPYDITDIMSRADCLAGPIFDKHNLWKESRLDNETAKKELADIGVVFFCLAHLLYGDDGGDIVEDVLRKAEDDIKRGER